MAKWVSIQSLPPGAFSTPSMTDPAGQSCYQVGSYTSWTDPNFGISHYVCQATPGRITVNGSTAYLNDYEIKHSMDTTDMGMSRITGETGFSNSFISTKSDGTQRWTTGDYGESILVKAPSGLRIYYGGSLLTFVVGSSVVTPKERYRLFAGTQSKTFSDEFLTDASTQRAYVLLQGGGGGGGRGGYWGATSSGRNGGGGGGGAGGFLLARYTLFKGITHTFTAGSAGAGASVMNTAGGDGGYSGFNSSDGWPIASANGGSGGKAGSTGSGNEGGTGGTTFFGYGVTQVAAKSGASGGGSNSSGNSVYSWDLPSLDFNFGWLQGGNQDDGAMSTFTYSATTHDGGTTSGDNNYGQGGGGGASFYGDGGNSTKETASVGGGRGAGGAGGTSRLAGGGGPSGASGGRGFVMVFW